MKSNVKIIPKAIFTGLIREKERENNNEDKI